MLLLIAFFYFRDRALYRRLSAYESAIDDLHSRVFELEASGGSNTKEITAQKEIIEALTKVEERFDEKLSELGEPLLRVIRAVKKIEQNLAELEERIDQKIAKIEESLKPTIRKEGSKEKRILKLYKEGLSIEEIANRERIPHGEVEFILKMSKLR
jgi:chromosome segregation ATPase